MKRSYDKIALLHHTGGGNLGDDATLDAVISNIRQRRPAAEITILSMNPIDTQQRHSVPSLPIRRHTWGIGYRSERVRSNKIERFGLRSWLQTTRNPIVHLPRAIFTEIAFLVVSYRNLKEYGQLVVSGGGQLTERSGPWSFPYAILVWIIMAKIAGLKCIFLSVGAGPLKHPLSRFFVARSLSAADYVSFRDAQSQTLARQVGFAGKSQVRPDNAYLLEPPPLSISLAAQRCPVVGLAPMPYPFCDPREFASGHQEIYDNYIAKFAIFASALAKESYSLKMFGSDVGTDASAIEDLRRVLRNQHNIATPPYEPVNSVEGLLSRMTEMDYVVTCRFHGVVFAHMLNKPVIAISHHPKVDNLMDAIDMARYCVDIQTFDPIELAKRFASLVLHISEVRQSLASSLAANRLKVERQFDQLFPSATSHNLAHEQGRHTWSALPGRSTEIFLAGLQGTKCTPGESHARLLGAAGVKGTRGRGPSEEVLG
jgi:polysaccharide pyruvyl transferase WcaK-like protein